MPFFYALNSRAFQYGIHIRRRNKMNSSRNKIRFIAEGAVIAALYAALTLLFLPISFGAQGQLRISEALTILPFFTPAAVPGLFTGCLIANILGGQGPIDIIFGSLATLLAAWATSKMRRPLLAPLPPIILNGVIVGAELSFLYQLPLFATMGWVALGEIGACFGLGYLLLKLLEPNRRILFGRE